MTAANATIPSVYASGAPDAVSAVTLYRNPAPTTSGPSRLSGRRHHVYAPTATYDATNELCQTQLPFGSTSVGLRAVAHAITAVATVPPTPTASTTNTRSSLRPLHSSRETDPVAIRPHHPAGAARDTSYSIQHAG